MGLFNFLRKKNRYPSEGQKLEEGPNLQLLTQNESCLVHRSEVDLTKTISGQERELAAVVTSAILAGTNENAYMCVRNVMGIDTDKEIAAAIVAAVAAHDKPEASFRLTSITRIQQGKK